MRLNICPVRNETNASGKLEWTSSIQR